MTHGAQQQHPAQGSSINPSPQAQASNIQPILTHDDPTHGLEKYRTLCRVDSVYYDPAGSYCAVVLDVGFKLGSVFKYASFATRVPGIRLDQFPEHDEIVRIAESIVKKKISFAPDVAVAGFGVKLGSMSHQVDERRFRFLSIRLEKPACHDEIRWQFVNPKGNYFPSSVKLLLLVKGEGPCFTFNLEIPPTLEIRVRMKWWHIWTTVVKPKLCKGWSCEIKNNYYPDRAKKFALEYEKPSEKRERSQMVGLHAAMDSYLGERNEWMTLRRQNNLE